MKGQDLFDHVDALAAEHDVTVSSTMIKVTYNKSIKSSSLTKPSVTAKYSRYSDNQIKGLQTEVNKSAQCSPKNASSKISGNVNGCEIITVKSKSGSRTLAEVRSSQTEIKKIAADNSVINEKNGTASKTDLKNWSPNNLKKDKTRKEPGNSPQKKKMRLFDLSLPNVKRRAADGLEGLHAKKTKQVSESGLEVPDRKADDKELLVKDPSLPPGWERCIHTRMGGVSQGRQTVFIISPEGKKFTFKGKLKKYLEIVNSPLKIDQFNFGLYKNSISRVNSNEVTPRQIKLQIGDNKTTLGVLNEEEVGRRFRCKKEIEQCFAQSDLPYKLDQSYFGVHKRRVPVDEEPKTKKMKSAVKTNGKLGSIKLPHSKLKGLKVKTALQKIKGERKIKKKEKSEKKSQKGKSAKSIGLNKEKLNNRKRIVKAKIVNCKKLKNDKGRRLGKVKVTANKLKRGKKMDSTVKLKKGKVNAKIEHKKVRIGRNKKDVKRTNLENVMEQRETAMSNSMLKMGQECGNREMLLILTKIDAGTHENLVLSPKSCKEELNVSIGKKHSEKTGKHGIVSSSSGKGPLRKSFHSPDLSKQSPKKTVKPVGIKENNDIQKENGREPMYDDSNLPCGWRRNIHVRATGDSAGKMDVVIISPDGRKHRYKQGLELYLKEQGLDLKVKDFDFSVYGKSSRRSTSAKSTSEATSISKTKSHLTNKGGKVADENGTDVARASPESLLINGVSGLMINCGLSTAKGERRLQKSRHEREKIVKSYLESSASAISKNCDVVPTSWIHKIAKCRSEIGTLQPNAASAIASATQEFISKFAALALRNSEHAEKGLQYDDIADLVDTSTCLSPLKVLIPKKITFRDFIRACNETP